MPGRNDGAAVKKEVTNADWNKQENLPAAGSIEVNSVVSVNPEARTYELNNDDTTSVPQNEDTCGRLGLEGYLYWSDSPPVVVNSLTWFRDLNALTFETCTTPTTEVKTALFIL